MGRVNTPLSKLPVRTRVARQAGLLAASVSRKLGRGEGSVIGGRVTLLVDPTALETLAHSRTVALVSGTNGKTTTTSLLTAALQTKGPVSTNSAGANMYGGMVSALSSSNAKAVVLETDEGHLPKALTDTDPQVVLLLNLTRDQLDRVGEVRSQALKWREALKAHPTAVVANADDPLVVWAAEPASSLCWVAGGSGWRLDAASCPNCGSKIDWEEVNWNCSKCELRRPTPQIDLDETDVILNAGATKIPLQLALPGEINRKNAAMALGAALELGAEPVAAVSAMAQLSGVGGRFASSMIGETKVRLLLAKNPAGWTESLRMTANDETPLVVSINARVQDGRDPSWLWDVPFERLGERKVIATGERGRDLAVRLLYAGVDHEFVPDGRQAVERASQFLESDQHDEEIDVIGNYSAFQDFRKLAR